MDLPHFNIVKHIFLCQIYVIIFAPTTADRNSITYDLWSVILKYDLAGIVLSYLTGAALEDKHQWKMICNFVVYRSEQDVWREGLQRKGAFRFNKVHMTLEPSLLYIMIKADIRQRDKFMNLMRILAYPEQSELCECTVCGCPYADTVDHYVMKCQGLITLRNVFWDNILDALSCDEEANLLRKDDDDILSIVLSGESDIYKDRESYLKCVHTVAKHIDSLMYIV